MSVFKDFPGLENLEKKFQGFQGLTRALCDFQQTLLNQHVSYIIRNLVSNQQWVGE